MRIQIIFQISNLLHVIGGRLVVILSGMPTPHVTVPGFECWFCIHLPMNAYFGKQWVMV